MFLSWYWLTSIVLGKKPLNGLLFSRVMWVSQCTPTKPPKKCFEMLKCTFTGSIPLLNHNVTSKLFIKLTTAKLPCQRISNKIQATIVPYDSFQQIRLFPYEVKL